MGQILSGATAVAGLVGGPDQVLHSLSPIIHNAAFSAAGLDWVYVGFPVENGRAPQAIRGLAAAGVRGLNVTMPHKLAAAGEVDRLEGLAALTGAVNTIVPRGGELAGWNTDGEGLIRFIEDDAHGSVEGASALVLGAGGSARSAVAALAQAGAASVSVLARDPRAAAELSVLSPSVPFSSGSLQGDAARLVRGAGIVVNASPVGQDEAVCPIPPELIPDGALVVDLVYRPPVTALVAALRVRGIRAYGGVGMLVRQAALSFEIWTGVEAPLEAMKGAVAAEAG